MKPSQLLCLTALPTALAAYAMPALGQVFLNEAQALNAIFGPDVTATRELKSLTDAQRKQLEQSSGLHFPESSYTFLPVAKHNQPAGYGLVVNEIGKSEPITFMVGMGADGKVVDVALMVFRESRGAEVKEQRFLRQFHGKRVGDPIQVDRDILNYTGATLSSKALARGVKRALLLLQQFYPPSHRGEPGGSRLTPPPLAALAVTEGPRPAYLYRQARYRMGTVCEMRVWAASPEDAVSAFATGFDEVARLDRIFSNYRYDSELTYVNRTAAERPAELSPELGQLTRHALRWWKKSRGTLDITTRPLLEVWGLVDGVPRVPSATQLASARERVGPEKLELHNRTIRFRRPGMELDFGGLAKGYAAEQAALQMCRSRALAALVNLGRSSLSAAAGDELRDHRRTASGSGGASGLEVGEWPIVIADLPGLPQSSSCLVLSSGWSMATSGSDQQSFITDEGRILAHIMDPRTGWPIGGPCRASVISRSGLHSETLTKPLLLLEGLERERFLRRVGGAGWVLASEIRGKDPHTWEPRKWHNMLVPVPPTKVVA